MRRPRIAWLLLLVVAGLISSRVCSLRAWGQQISSYQLETVESPPKGVAEEIAKALQPRGIRLVGEEGKVIGELWLRSTVPLKPTTYGSGYGSLAEGTLVGVLSFPQGGSDFRGQTIQPGVYTLRYERIPEDGYHAGASPEMDFLLLCPAAADKELNASFNFNDLVELSRQATSTGHPAPLMLLPITNQQEFPGTQKNYEGHVAIRAKTLGKPQGSESTAAFPLALVLVGKADL